MFSSRDLEVKLGSIAVNHSYEEIRSVAIDLLAGREKADYDLSQYEHLKISIASALQRREHGDIHSRATRDATLSPADREIYLEVFWGLFREGIITLGFNDSNREFPFFRVSEFGRRILEGGQVYFFHDVSTYERAIRSEVPAIDTVTLVYLKEAMQAFKAGCILSSTVMLGVATEHTFLLLIEEINQNPAHASTYANVELQRTILQKINKFKNILEQQRNLPAEIKEDLDTNFAGILSIIRNFRNQSGHPSGKIIDREQAYILLQLFIPYCKKMYQLIAYFT